jgi:hypothetical protein
VYAHYAFHARGRLTPLWTHGQAAWLWRHIRAGFPAALGATLMPDHGHVIAYPGGRRRLAAILGAFARAFAFGDLWLPVGEPHRLTTPDKLQRGVRYCALNPSRPTKLMGRTVQLVSDPLAWPWSTHRDVVGAIIDPWVDATHLAAALGRKQHNFRERFHRYVSSDHWVHVDGTPLPESAPSSLVRTGELRDIASAALAATRSNALALRSRGRARTAFIGLAYHCGWREPSTISQICGVHPKGVSRTARACPPEWLEAAAFCLHDARLRHVCSPLNVAEGNPRAAATLRSASSVTFGNVRA